MSSVTGSSEPASLCQTLLGRRERTRLGGSKCPACYRRHSGFPVHWCGLARSKRLSGRRASRPTVRSGGSLIPCAPFSRERMTCSGGRYDGRRSARREFVAPGGWRGFDSNVRAAELIFGELIAKAARHGGTVDVAFEWEPPQAVLHVIDRGNGCEEPDDSATALLAEHGRGLWLVSGRSFLEVTSASIPTNRRLLGYAPLWYEQRFYRVASPYRVVRRV